MEWLTGNKRKRKMPPSSATASLSGTGKAQEPQPGPLNLYDAASLHKALEEATREAFVDYGIPEDLRVSNIKLSLGFASCLCAAISQSYPGKWPATRPIILVCVIVYLIISAVTAIFQWKIEGNAFLHTKRTKDLPPLKVSAKLPRYSDQWSWTVRRADAADPSPVAFKTASIATYFHENGYISKVAVQQDVGDLLKKVREGLVQVKKAQ